MAKKKPQHDDVEELDRAYVSITGYKPKFMRQEEKKKKHGGSIALRLVCILAVIVLIFAGAFFLTARYTTFLDGVLKMPQVSMGGIPMEGMTKQEAKDTLRSLCEESYGKTTMVIRVLDTVLELTPEQAGITPDTDTAVDMAFRERASGTFDLIPYLRLNESAIRDAVNALGAQYNTELQQTACAITGTQPSLEAGSPENEDGMTLTITIGSPAYGLDTEALYRQVIEAYSSGVFLVEGSCSQLEPELPDLDALYEQTYIAPVDAVMDGETFEISPDSYGYHFDLDAAKAQITDAAYGQTLTFPFSKIPPQVTAASLSATLMCDVLGSAQTPYKGKDTNNRNTNLAIACEAINGLVLLPGETFSYNDTLGERTADKGYKDAPSYVGGLTVDTLGGGICQVSSTLYYSTLFADLEIVERHNHGYVSDYIPKGMDATVTWDGADFRFRNDTDYPIRIEAWRADGYVNVRILGTEVRDYYVKMSYKVRESTPYDTVYEEYPKDNPKGYRDGQEIVTPYKGYVVQTYKEKYSKETDELISKDKWTYDVYKKRDRVICKIVDTPSTEATE